MKYKKISNKSEKIFDHMFFIETKKAIEFSVNSNMTINSIFINDLNLNQNLYNDLNSLCKIEYNRIVLNLKLNVITIDIYNDRLNRLNLIINGLENSRIRYNEIHIKEIKK